MTRVLVCGGRDYSDTAHVNGVLDSIHGDSPISCIIAGGASGADELAFRWAERRDICEIRIFKADWDAHGKAAGPLRNQRMIDEGRPDLVVAFPGGRGTADMVRRAKAAGIRLMEPIR